jgi:integrase
MSELQSTRVRMDHWGTEFLAAAQTQCVAQFEAVVGALPADAIGDEAVALYCEHLRLAGLSESARRRRLDTLRQLVFFGNRIGHLRVSRNPFRASHPAQANPRLENTPRPLTTGALRHFFSCGPYTAPWHPTRQPEAADYWMPLLALYTGARLRELAGLRTHDICPVGRDWTMRLTRPIFMPSSPRAMRRLHIHAELVDCGFLSFVAARESAGTEMLFPVEPGRPGNPRPHIARRISWQLERAGIKGQGVSSMSFRASFGANCSACGVSPEMRDALLGWPDGTGANVMAIEPLASQLRMVRYSELDLKHLHVAAPMEGVEWLLETRALSRS